jgi:hypothetical protein
MAELRLAMAAAVAVAGQVRLVQHHHLEARQAQAVLEEREVRLLYQEVL